MYEKRRMTLVHSLIHAGAWYTHWGEGQWSSYQEITTWSFLIHLSNLYPTSDEVLLISHDLELRDSKPQASFPPRFYNLSIRIPFVYAPFQHSFSLPRNLYSRHNSVLWQSSVANSSMARVNATFFPRFSEDSSSSWSKYCVFKRPLNKFTVSSKLEWG